MRVYQCSNCYYEIEFQSYLERGGLCPICYHIINPTNYYETEPSVQNLKSKSKSKECDTKWQDQ